MDDGNECSAAAAAPDLPDDVIVEILSRLPVRPLCRCKCVSRSWRDLIAHPDHRRRLAQTVSGFFYHRHVDASCPPVPYWSFAALRGAPAVDAAFPFLPPSYSRTDTEILDSCNGLLLLRCSRGGIGSSSSPDHDDEAVYAYVVCNPATGEWVELPEPHHAPGTFGLRSEQREGKRRTRLAALAFDPAVSSSHFHVFQLVERVEEAIFDLPFEYRFVVEAVEIYSSRTGAWTRRASEWHVPVACGTTGGQAACHNGSLHLAVHGGAVASVDTSGQDWRVIGVLQEPSAAAYTGGFIGRSQGQLLYVAIGSGVPSVSVCALESGWDGAAECWTDKHVATMADPTGRTWFGKQHGVVAVHPDGNVIFLFDSYRGWLMAYDMDRWRLRDVCTLAQAAEYHPFFSYTPLYPSEALSSG